MGFVFDPLVPVLIVVLLQRLPEAAKEHAGDGSPSSPQRRQEPSTEPTESLLAVRSEYPLSPASVVGQSRCERSNDANDLFAAFHFSELWALGSCLFSQILSQKVKGGKRPFGSFAGSFLR